MGKVVFGDMVDITGIKHWLEDEKISLNDMSVRIGHNRSYLWKVLTGEVRMSETAYLSLIHHTKLPYGAFLEIGELKPKIGRDGKERYNGYTISELREWYSWVDKSTNLWKRILCDMMGVRAIGKIANVVELITKESVI